MEIKPVDPQAEVSEKPLFTGLDLGIERLLEEGRGAAFGAVTRSLTLKEPVNESIEANKQDKQIQFQEFSSSIITVVPTDRAPHSVQVDSLKQSGEPMPYLQFHTGRDFKTYKTPQGTVLGFEALTDFRHKDYFSWFGLFESYKQHQRRQQFDASGALFRRTELDCQFHKADDLQAACQGKVFDAQGQLISRQESQYFKDGRVRVKVSDGQNNAIGFVLSDENSVRTSLF